MKIDFSTLLAASLMLLGGTQAFAQMSVNAGYINSAISTKNALPSNANGAYAGLSYNLPIAGGLGINAGAFKVTVGYDYGMMNQYMDDDYPQMRRSNLKIGVGFTF